VSRQRKAAADAPPAGREIFRYEARREGRPVAVLRAVDVAGEVTVETEVFPVTQAPDSESVRRPFVFHSRDHARKFADDALTALEYLNCVVAE
jgi:hypothetical protein